MIGEWNNGTGRRKSSVARVFLKKGSGKITVNGKDIEQFFGRQTSIRCVRHRLDDSPYLRHIADYIYRLGLQHLQRQRARHNPRGSLSARGSPSSD